MSDIIWKNVEKLAVQNVSALVVNCEHNFNRQIYAVADDIFDKSEVSLVLIAGPSASGKTTSADLLAERLEARGIKTHRVSTDDYFIDKDKIPVLSSGLKDYDSLRAVNVPLLQQHIQTILNYGKITLPRFDFLKGKSFPDGDIVDCGPEDVVIIEGIHALNPAIISWRGDVNARIKKISIAPRRSFIMESGIKLIPDELRLLRRLIRDFYTRGYSFEETLKQWSEVKEAENVYILPYVGLADYKIDSVYDYELIVYKQCIYSRLKDTHLEALQIIRKALAEVNGMRIETIPKNSLLNEFVGFMDD